MSKCFVEGGVEGANVEGTRERPSHDVRTREMWRGPLSGAADFFLALFRFRQIQPRK